MSDKLNEIVKSRSDSLRRKITRRRLVFLQCGSVWNCARDPLLESIGGYIVSVDEITELGSINIEDDQKLVIIDGVENFADLGTYNGYSLGEFRIEIDRILDQNISVCLVSRSPRSAFRAVPGSSILEDSSPHFMSTLSEDEREDECKTLRSSTLPDIGLGLNHDVSKIIENALTELGLSQLAALDAAIYGTSSDTFLGVLGNREIEGLIGAGLVRVDNSNAVLVDSRIYSELREALSNVLSRIVDSQGDLPGVSKGLWTIERTIRSWLREDAISEYGSKWRNQIFNDGMGKIVLDRARADTNFAARSLAELRDPIEWLTLGELLDVSRVEKFNQLGIQAVVWRKFANEIIPIRNRLSHMRLLQRGDKELVTMWVSQLSKIRRT
ncbi:hypothetical protein ACT89R_17280 [Rhodococcus qingshengii]